MEIYKYFYVYHITPALKSAGINVDKNFQDTTPSTDFVANYQE